MSKPVITFVRVQSATQWTASVHTLHMSKPVTTFVFRVLRDGIPAQERHLRKESGKMATEIAPKLRFSTKTPKKNLNFQALQQYATFTKYCVYHKNIAQNFAPL